jgi:hypothetical protein
MNDKKELVILGDSFCHGIGTVSPHKNILNTQQAFGRYLAEHYGLAYVNLAEPGISISRTAELGYNYILENRNKIERVVVGWTHPGRIGLYSDCASWQILPQYMLLGDTADSDVFTEDNYITDRNNQQHLKLLPQVHRIIIENDFFHGQFSVSKMIITLFKTWLDSIELDYVDFNVFPGYDMINPAPTSQLTFNQVLNPVRHPNSIEQAEFAKLLIQDLAR